MSSKFHRVFFTMHGRARDMTEQKAAKAAQWREAEDISTMLDEASALNRSVRGQNIDARRCQNSASNTK